MHAWKSCTLCDRQIECCTFSQRSELYTNFTLKKVSRILNTVGIIKIIAFSVWMYLNGSLLVQQIKK